MLYIKILIRALVLGYWIFVVLKLIFRLGDKIYFLVFMLSEIYDLNFFVMVLDLFDILIIK
jgi:hypothetical protein